MKGAYKAFENKSLAFEQFLEHDLRNYPNFLSSDSNKSEHINLVYQLKSLTAHFLPFLALVVFLLALGGGV